MRVLVEMDNQRVMELGYIKREIRTQDIGRQARKKAKEYFIFLKGDCLQEVGGEVKKRVMVL